MPPRAVSVDIYKRGVGKLTDIFVLGPPRHRFRFLEERPLDMGAQPLRLEAKTPQTCKRLRGNGLRIIGLGRVELPTSRLSGDRRGVRSPARSL